MENFFKGFANVYNMVFSFMYEETKGAVKAWPEKNWYTFGRLAACLSFIIIMLVL